MTAALMTKLTVRRGPIVSSAQPTGNCAATKPAIHQACMLPSAWGPSANSIASSGAMTARNERKNWLSA